MFSLNQNIIAKKTMTSDWSNAKSTAAQSIVCSQFYTGSLAVS
jgi:hypothetical protein